MMEMQTLFKSAKVLVEELQALGACSAALITRAGSGALDAITKVAVLLLFAIGIDGARLWLNASETVVS